MNALEGLTRRLPEVDREAAMALLEEAEGMLLAYTGRASLPEALETAKIQLAVVLCNRQGIEGQTSHSEGGVSRSLEGIPQEIRFQAMPYRLAKIVRMSGR